VLLVALAQIAALYLMNVLMFGFPGPAGNPWQWLLGGFAVNVVVASIAAMISHAELRRALRAGEPISVTSAASGPFALTILAGIPLFFVSPWFAAITWLMLMLLLGTAGFYAAAKKVMWGE